MMILGIDAGNSEVKVCSERGVFKFPSDISEWRERKLKSEPGEFEIEYEYKGEKGFGGILAQNEGEFNARKKGDSKAHEETLLRTLFALNYFTEEDFEIVVGQPINRHTEDEKQKIINLLQGKHSIIINGKEKFFRIRGVKVAAEEGAAFWCEPEDDLCHIVGVGAGTVGGATLLNKRYIDKESFSLNFGADTIKNLDLYALSRKIALESNWNRNDKVKLVGGLAEELFPYIQSYFPKAKVLYPFVKGKTIHPIYANCVGFYEIARVVYGY